MREKLIPVITMLTAGAITSIICIVQRRDALKSLIILLCVLIIFYIIGRIAKALIYKIIFSQKPEKIESETPEDITDEELTENDREA